MKKTLLKKRVSILAIMFFMISQFAFSQVPPENLTGEELKSWLITNYYDGKHQTLGYSTARMYLYNYIDNENGIITCVYSGLEVNSPYGGTTTYPAPINCEHTIPQSFFNEAEPMKSDIHHLFPTYENWNSTRSNYPLTDIDDNSTTKWMYLNQSQTTIPASNIDLYSEYANSTFEPRENHKGNAARAIFYFYTMYPTEAGDISQIGDINIFYQWHLDDPVDATEIERNNEIETYQGNRNPYIDYPETVASAWDLTPVNNPPSTPALQLTSNETSISLAWDNVSDENGYKLYKSDDAANYSLLVELTANTTNHTDNSVIEETTYSYYIIAYNDYGNSNNSNIVSGQLNSGGNGITTEVMFSEYIEGSSYNKGLEVANFTGSAVDLSNYSIRKQTNGAGDWGTILSLSGSLAHTDVYVIVHSSASTDMKAVADLETGVDALSFNGNDAIGLFKNGTLIDIIGIFNSSTDYAKDVTIVRNSDVYSPSTTYTTSEWTSYPTNTYAYLGSHTVDGGTTPPCDIPTSLAVTNITENSATLSWSNVTEAVNYDVKYKETASATWINDNTASTSLNISGLNSATEYEFQIATVCSDGTSDYSSSTIFTTIQGEIIYCQSHGNYTYDEWIDQVIIANLNNYSGDNSGYADFTNLTANLETGTTYNITLYPGFSGRNYKEVYSIWIDYNHDGIFDDATELAFTYGSRYSTVYGSFTVPDYALPGKTRMRVSMKYNKAATPCEVFTYGEVEDYTVDITTTKAATLASVPKEPLLTNLKVKLYPNPAEIYTTLELITESKTNFEYKVIDLQGRVLLTKNSISVNGYKEEKIDISNLKSGVYFIMISNNEIKETLKLIVK